MYFEGKYHSLDFLSINAWNAPEVSSALCVTCFHQWVENLKTRIIITNKTVALAKEFVIAPYLGVGRGKKEKKKKSEEGKRQTNQAMTILEVLL